MNRYLVLTPEYEDYEYVPGVETSCPMGLVRDVFIVDAPNSNSAKWAVLKEAKYSPWCCDAKSDKTHPLKGMSAKNVGFDYEVSPYVTYIKVDADGSFRGSHNT